MSTKKCKHLLSAGECWLCKGNSRSQMAKDFAESAYHDDLIIRIKKAEVEIFSSENREWWNLHENGGDIENVGR